MRPYSYLGGNRGLTRLISGQMFYVNTDDRSITPWIIDGGYWELFVDDLLSALTKPGDTAIDVGANMGYYTVKMGDRVGPRGRVYSFEPNPETFAFLQDNVYINAMQSVVELHNVALGGESGEGWLTFDRHYPGGAAVSKEKIGEGDEIRVPVVRLDDVIGPQATIAVVKIDVEGFEPMVLQGMAGVLSRSPDAAVVVELSYPHWARFGDPAALLKAAADGRDIYMIHRNGRIELLPQGGETATLDPGFLSYVLLLPRTETRRRQVARFLGSDRSKPPISPQLSRRYRWARRIKAAFFRHLVR
jgi:FkbM family methyltransferase